MTCSYIHGVLSFNLTMEHYVNIVEVPCLSNTLILVTSILIVGCYCLSYSFLERERNFGPKVHRE